MSIEEKAKAYDEAIKKAKEIKEKIVYSHLSMESCKAVSEYIDTIIPELSESEDEKIRKDILHFLKAKLENCTTPTPAKSTLSMWIDHLEKQKEQNGKDEECTDFTIYHPLKNGKGEYECIPYSFYGSLTSFSEDKDLIDFLRTCFYTKEECNKWIDKQKEQKPAWREEDETIIEGACNALEIHGHTRLASMLKSICLNK